MTMPLPEFSGDTPRCTMCGHEGTNTEYRAYGTCEHHGAYVDIVIGYEPNPRLCRTCRRCGHAWDEATVTPTAAHTTQKED